MRRTVNVSVWSIFLVAFLVAVAVVTLAVSIEEQAQNTDHTRRILRDDLCGVARAVIAPNAPAPTTTHGKAVTDSMRDLYVRLGCTT